MPVSPNLRRDETRTEEHTLACHLPCRASGLTRRGQPPGAKRPSSAKLPREQPTAKRTQRGGRPVLLETGVVKNELSRKPRGPASASRRPRLREEVLAPTAGGTRTPLQTRFLFPRTPADGRAAVGAIEGPWRGYSLACPKGPSSGPRSGYPSRRGFFCPYSSLCQKSDQCKL